MCLLAQLERLTLRFGMPKFMESLLQPLCRAVLKVINLEFSEPDMPLGWQSPKGSVIISNHISYLDVLIINATFRAIFVTSEEIRNSGFLGEVTKSAGCLFVDRDNIMRLKQDLAVLTDQLAKGRTVMFFPEGSTGSGGELLPFKSSLLAAVERTGSPVHSLAIKYTTVNGETYSESNCDLVAWYGDMQFFPHLWKLLQQSSVTAELRFTGTFRPVPGRRKQMTRQIKDSIAKSLSEAVTTACT